MSMLRCLYRRVKLVKCSHNETGASITLNVSDPRSAQQYLVSLHARNLSGMTFSARTVTSSAGRNSANQPAEKAEKVSLFRNGEWIVDTSLKNTSLSEGYYRNDWERERRRSQNARSEKKCNFNFSSINVRLLETFGFIGTAVAVGIDVRTRINEFMPQHRRGFHDFCQQHHHHHNSSSPSKQSNGTQAAIQQAGVSRVLDLVGSKPPSCVAKDPNLTTIRYCGSCTVCSCVFDKFLHLYVTVFPSLPSSSTASATSSILGVLPRKASAVPKVGFDHFDAGHEEASEEDDVDGFDGPSIPQKPHFDCTLVNSAFINEPEASALNFEEEEIVRKAEEDAAKARQRKKSVFQFNKEHNEQNKPSEVIQADSAKAESVSQSSQSSCETAESGFASAKSTSEPSSPPVAQSGKEEELPDDIAAVFRMASIEYADQLNNLVAISLMNGHKPDEAMQCWSSCETSSRAFFNMGVAYESGRHAKNAKPDLDRAHDCYALAASMGHRDAIFNLALFYLYGKGKVEVNLERGIDLLEIAAAKGVESAQSFCAQLHRQQLLDEIRENLQRKISKVDTLKQRPLRTSMIRPSASLFGTASTQLRPKRAANHEPAGGGLKRNNSAPNLHDLNKSSPIVIASK